MLPAKRGVVIIPRLVGESKFSPSSNFNALSWQSRERAGEEGEGRFANGLQFPSPFPLCVMSAASSFNQKSVETFDFW